MFDCVRYYDPRTGRFLSEDPIGFENGDNNLYKYVANNPLKYADPSGESFAGYAALRIGISTVMGEMAAICTAAPDTCYYLINKMMGKPELPSNPAPIPPKLSCNPEFQSCPKPPQAIKQCPVGK